MKLKYGIAIFLLVMAAALTLNSLNGENRDFNLNPIPDDSNKKIVIVNIENFNDSILDLEDLDDIDFNGLDSLGNVMIKLDSLINCEIRVSLDSLDLHLEKLDKDLNCVGLNINIEEIKNNIDGKKIKVMVTKDFVDSIMKSVNHIKEDINTNIKDSLKCDNKRIMLYIKSDDKQGIKLNKNQKEDPNFNKMTDEEIRNHFKESDPDLKDENIYYIKSNR